MRAMISLTVTLLMAAPLAALASRAGSQSPASEGAVKPTAELTAPTAAQVAAAKRQGKVKVKLQTTKGVIEMELDAKAAPVTVANFLNLVKAGFYHGMPFHRVEPGFVIQAGDPAQVGRPPVGFTIPDEKSPIKHTKGTIAMARTYRAGQMVPNSGSTQFYITLAGTPHLDRLGFTAFGKVISGMSVVEKIAVGDKITKASVVGKAAGKRR
jgi:peptidyl-prolyl cis-trans isomerase B (cyclophilin B)